jgi:hypothetical protein
MKTEDDARVLLRDAASHYPTQPPPMRRLFDLGRRVKRRRRSWLAGAAAAVVVLVATVGGLLLQPSGDPGTVGPIDATESDPSTTAAPTDATPSPQVVEIPSMYGYEQHEATSLLEMLGLTVVVSNQRAGCDQADVVIDQDPPAGDEAPMGSAVVIRVGIPAGIYDCAPVPPEDRRIAEAFAAFAADPSLSGPFAPSVALGLGNEFRKAIARSDVTDPSQWRLDLTGYAERSGALAVLDLVATHTATSELTTDVSPSFCPSTLRDEPPSDLTGGGHAIRMKTRHYTSCAELWTVDLYINDANEIVGVNVSLGAP